MPKSEIDDIFAASKAKGKAAVRPPAEAPPTKKNKKRRRAADEGSAQTVLDPSVQPPVAKKSKAAKPSEPATFKKSKVKSKQDDLLFKDSRGTSTSQSFIFHHMLSLLTAAQDEPPKRGTSSSKRPTSRSTPRPEVSPQDRMPVGC
jgi:hypothetical protein